LTDPPRGAIVRSRGIRYRRWAGSVRATHHWRLRPGCRAETIAKMQYHCTWGACSLPYLPVMNLGENMPQSAKIGVDGIMSELDARGYPSPNLRSPADSAQTYSEHRRCIGCRGCRTLWARGAPLSEKGNGGFRQHFGEYLIIRRNLPCPVQMGPSNPLYLNKTGYRRTMVGTSPTMI